VGRNSTRFGSYLLDIDRQNGKVTDIARFATEFEGGTNDPSAMAFSSQNTLYVVDRNRALLYRLTPQTGVVLQNLALSIANIGNVAGMVWIGQRHSRWTTEKRFVVGRRNRSAGSAPAASTDNDVIDGGEGFNSVAQWVDANQTLSDVIDLVGTFNPRDAVLNGEGADSLQNVYAARLRVGIVGRVLDVAAPRMTWNNRSEAQVMTCFSMDPESKFSLGEREMIAIFFPIRSISTRSSSFPPKEQMSPISRLCPFRCALI